MNRSLMTSRDIRGRFLMQKGIMSKHSVIVIAVLVVIVTLACSPSVIAREILGDNAAASTATLPSPSAVAQAPTLGASPTTQAPNPMLTYQITSTLPVQTPQSTQTIKA